MLDGIPYQSYKLVIPRKYMLLLLNYWRGLDFRYRVLGRFLDRNSLRACATMSSVWAWTIVATILCILQGVLCTYQCGKGITADDYAECKLLPALGASLAFTYRNSTNTIDFAFTEDLESASGWVAWGINPDGNQMVGTQALAAFSNSTGVSIRTYNVNGAVKGGQAALVPGSVSVAYSNYSAVVVGSTATITGTILLESGQSTLFSIVWNRGPQVNVATAALFSHSLTNADNLRSTLEIDMGTGETLGGGEIPNKRLKDIHGILNAISWGILLPVGIMAARYLRPFEFADPAWFYLHIFCQVTGYVGGTAGWVLGLRLQKFANPIKYFHRNLGISIWALATFQVLAAILLRPKPETKHRPLWNVIHHTTGFAIIILSIINIFEGIDLLGEDNWKRVYITVLIVIGLIAFVLELITWFHWLQKKDRKRKHTALVEDT